MSTRHFLTLLDFSKEELMQVIISLLSVVPWG